MPKLGTTSSTALATLLGACLFALSATAQPAGKPKPLTAAQGTEFRTGQTPHDTTGKTGAGEGVYGTSPSPGSMAPRAPGAIGRGGAEPACATATVESPSAIARCAGQAAKKPAR